MFDNDNLSLSQIDSHTLDLLKVRMLNFILIMDTVNFFLYAHNC